MKYFTTRYYAGDTHPFLLSLAADDHEHATRLAKVRNIGETVLEPSETTDLKGVGSLIVENDFLGAAHEASILGYVALASGAAAPAEILSDLGLVHDLMHLALGINGGEDPINRQQRLIDLAGSIESRVPGWPIMPAPMSPPRGDHYVLKRNHVSGGAYEHLLKRIGVDGVKTVYATNDPIAAERVLVELKQAAERGQKFGAYDPENP